VNDTSYARIIAYRDCKIVTSSQLSDFTNASERSSHDNSLVAKLLVVVEDILDTLDTRILLSGVFLLGGSLVPIEDTTNEWRNEESTSFSCGNCLREREHKCQIAVDLMLRLKDFGSFDAFPCGCDLDQNTVLGDANFFVKLS